MHVSVTIVIVNWNKRDIVVRLLDSLVRLDYPSFNIIVVDNASSDGSVDAVRHHASSVVLLENKENLGGTGGFNAGIRYALQHFKPKYIWLLDNDALVEPKALASLVSVMEADAGIGIAGSKILNADDPDVVVEYGAHIDWTSGDVIPVNRNMKNSGDQTGTVTVDYVAICSALLRANALQRVGLMDERYFLFWDDMDWGIAFQKAGYRVVAVNDSLVYHPAFTEKRSGLVHYYYGIRNPLLTISKYSLNFSGVAGMYRICRKACHIIGLSNLGKMTMPHRLCLRALRDFLGGAWGRAPSHLYTPAGITRELFRELRWEDLEGKILVLNTGNKEDILKILDMIRNQGGQRVHSQLLMDEDRQGLYPDVAQSDSVYVNLHADSVSTILSRFIQLIRSGYSITINPSYDKVSPYAPFAKSMAYWDPVTNRLLSTKSPRLISVACAFILAELSALLLMPFLLLRSMRYFVREGAGR